MDKKVEDVKITIKDTGNYGKSISTGKIIYYENGICNTIERKGDGMVDLHKAIELTQSQIKAFENGASRFIFPIVGSIKELEIKGNMISYTTFNNKRDESFTNEYLEDFIFKFSPIQKGDKDIFIKEEFYICTDLEDGTYDKEDMKDRSLLPASQMTKEQSRYSFKECIDVRVVRLQDITGEETINITRLSKSIGMTPFMDMVDLINIQLEEQNINRTYKDNDYVFLMEFKR